MAKYLLILLLFLFPWRQIPGQSTSTLGGLPGAPTRMGFGAYGMGNGNALTAVRSDQIVGYYNPALTPFQPRPVASLTVGFLPLDRNLNFVSYTQHLKPTAGVSFGIINAGVSDIDGRDYDGRHTESYSTSENVFLFSFGIKVKPNFAIGISTKILYYSLFSDVKSTTVGFDFGALYVLSDEWSVGAVIQDVGSKYKWDTSKLYGINGNSTIDIFPVRKRIGLCYAPQELALSSSLELESVAKMTVIRAGAQWILSEAFTLRAGIDQVCLSEQISSKPSAGFTTQTEIGAWITKLSYAYVIEPYSPSDVHLLTVAIEFR